MSVGRKESKEREDRLDEKLQDQIKKFDKSTLRRLPVYFANTNPDLKANFIPYHGFLVTGVPGSRDAYHLYVTEKKLDSIPSRIPNNSYLLSHSKLYFINKNRKAEELKVESILPIKKLVSELNKNKKSKKLIHLTLTGSHLQQFRELTNTGHKRPPSKAYQHGKAYKLATDLMRAPFVVSPNLIAKASKHKKIDKETIAALKKLKGKGFATVEYFIRQLLITRAKIEKRKITADEINEKIHNLDPSLKELIALNKPCNGYVGSHVPSSFYAKVAERDLELFQQNKTVHHQLNIPVTTLQEILDEQKMYSRFLDEKIGVGKSISEQSKIKILEGLRSHQVREVTKRYVYHETFPSGPFEANCNSSSATLAQACLDRANTKESKMIPTGTLMSHGSNRPMYLHDPLHHNKNFDNKKSRSDEKKMSVTSVKTTTFSQPTSRVHQPSNMSIFLQILMSIANGLTILFPFIYLACTRMLDEQSRNDREFRR